MSIFPSDVDLDIEVAEVEGDFKEYALNFETMQLKYNSSGENIILTGNEAIKVWIYKVLNTAKGVFKAYSAEFGNEIEDLIGYNYSKELTYSEIERLITESLTLNKYINSIENFNCNIEGSKVNIEFKVNTKYGEVNISV